MQCSKSDGIKLAFQKINQIIVKTFKTYNSTTMHQYTTAKTVNYNVFLTDYIT